MDYSQPGSSVHGIFQARVLEWGAILLIPTHIHTEACIDHYFLTKYRVLVLAFINNVHELKNKKKAQLKNNIQVPAKYFPYPTKLQNIYMGFCPFLVLTQLWLSFPLTPLSSTNKGFKFPTWVLYTWLQIFCVCPYLLYLQRWVC